MKPGGPSGRGARSHSEHSITALQVIGATTDLKQLILAEAGSPDLRSINGFLLSVDDIVAQLTGTIDNAPPRPADIARRTAPRPVRPASPKPDAKPGALPTDDIAWPPPWPVPKPPTGTRRQPGGDSGDARSDRSVRELAAWYRTRGYEVVAQGWRSRDGDLDLIARRGTTVAFCTIVAAPGHTGPTGRSAGVLTSEQRQEMRRTVSRWTESANPKPAAIRIDVAFMNGCSLDVTEGAV